MLSNYDLFHYFSRSRGRKGDVASLRTHKNKSKIPQKLNLAGFFLENRSVSVNTDEEKRLNKKHRSATLLRRRDFCLFHFLQRADHKQQSASFMRVADASRVTVATLAFRHGPAGVTVHDMSGGGPSAFSRRSPPPGGRSAADLRRRLERGQRFLLHNQVQSRIGARKQPI